MQTAASERCLFFHQSVRRFLAAESAMLRRGRCHKALEGSGWIRSSISPNPQEIFICKENFRFRYKVMAEQEQWSTEECEATPEELQCVARTGTAIIVVLAMLLPFLLLLAIICLTIPVVRQHIINAVTKTNR